VKGRRDRFKSPGLVIHFSRSYQRNHAAVLLVHLLLIPDAASSFHGLDILPSLLLLQTNPEAICEWLVGSQSFTTCVRRIPAQVPNRPIWRERTRVRLVTVDRRRRPVAVPRRRRRQSRCRLRSQWSAPKHGRYKDVLTSIYNSAKRTIGHPPLDLGPVQT
jgi:hypothetical protein